MDDTADTKRALRTRIRCERALREPERAARDRRILARLVDELDRRDGAAVAAVAAFAPLPGEPGGADLPARLAATGRTVWLPVVVGPGRPLQWTRWRGGAHTRTGDFGIREPVPDHGDAPVDTAEVLTRVGTVIVPALAVGRDGARLGQGGGYYDRTFASPRSGTTSRGRLIAVVDHEEYGLDVPATELDITVDAVVTDTGIFPGRHGRR
ncbi:5-formyltetrahydrofolate cyclo-ligase [uncultured Corynebacterium sp.]|uniref:5-formyltetrahydrofolate cyclo-ligase n=1 Tax=uncultured Corynebacterium sp. TaxID=159447 RepID=UPI0025EC779F|nr:5-formyltetrahydrofolate cyclo-ligase [uncultured Corynebacterium sp.]